MKHLKLFFALFAMLALGVGNAWGAEYELIATLDCAKASSEGTSALYGNSTTSMSADKVKAYINAAAGKTLISSNPTISGSIYWSKGSGGGEIPNNVLKLGKASGPGSVTFTINGTDNVVKVVIVGHGWKTSSSISVNSADAQKPSAQYTEQTFVFDNLSPTKDITISVTSSAVCITSIQLYKEASGGGETPDPTPSKLPTPANLKEASISETSATLSWDAVANASNYSVTINGNTETATTNSYSATGLTAGTEYTWSVVAKGDGTNYTDSEAAQHTFTTTATTPDPEPGTGTNVTYDFTKIDGFETWPTAYASGKGDVVYTEATVKFTGAVKQTQTITDCPVTKGGEVQLVLNSGYSNRDITNVTFVCRQWGTKSQTITLHYSTDGGVNYTKTEITSTNFTISSDNLPEGTNAVKITFSSSSNQVGIESVTFSLSSDDEPGTEEPVASLTANPTSLDFGNVTQNNEVEAKTFTISGSDFTTGELTITAPSGYTVNPTTVPVNGTLEETTITVTPNTSTVGTFNGNVTISGTNLKSSVNVALSMTVEKAPATPTDNVYVKVTSTEGLTDGEYLIVYEDAASETPAPVAFDGSLTTLDAAKNTVAVGISNSTIAGNTDIDAALFTIDVTAGTLKSASGKYIGVSSNTNGLKTEDVAKDYKNAFSVDDNGNAVIAADFEGSTMSLRYNNTAGDNNLRFRYYKNAGQQPIALYKKVDPNAVVEPQFKLAAGEYYGTQSVEITCTTVGAEIYYTLNGTDPTSASTKYTGAISIASTTTVKAIAVKGENSSAVVSATYTILAPLATMQEIFDKATDATQSVHIEFNDWVISGVVPGKDGKPSSNAYITDGSKGFIIYTKDGHGFNVGDKLSGTVVCDLTRYNGSAEVVGLTSSTTGLSVTTGGVVTPVEVADESTLSGVNTGAVIKITGPCTVDGTKYYVAGVQLYNSLYTYTDPESGYNYECTGVYLQYNTTKEILPRKAEDLVKIETQQPAGIAFAVTEHTAEVGATDFEEPELTNPNSLTVTYKTSDATLATINATTGEVTIGNKAGKVTITASFAGSDDFVAADASYNITITDPSISTVTFDATIDKTPDAETLSLTKDVITMTFTGGAMNNGENYRCYKNQTLTISAIDASIQKIEFECTSSNPISGFADATGLDKTNSVWTGDAKSIELTASNNQVRMSKVNVYYKKDNRADAGLAWNPATVSLTVGDAFTAPTFSNPNGLTVSFESSNTDLATVNNAGVISLVSGKTGTATITATYAGNETYKPAEVTCAITVDHKSEDVVILAKCKDQYYALVAEYVEEKNDVLQALPVEYVGGKIYNVETEDQASIIWKRVVVDGKTTFKNGDNYLSAVNSAALNLATEACEWVFEGDMYKIEGSTRTILYYTSTGGFKNYSINNMSNDGVNGEYSSVAITVAPVFADGDAYHRTVTSGNYGTICLPFGSTNYSGATFYECVGSEPGKVYLGSVTALEAGVPYIFQATATATELAVYSDGTTATEAGKANGLVGTFADNTPVPNNAYILYGGAFRTNNDETKPNKINAYRAYLDLSAVNGGAPQQMPGRRYIGMGVHGENGTTGLDDIMTTGTPVKVIENGQLIIIRNGEKYNVQGQKL